SLFGFKYHVELSTRPENSIGSDEDWNNATEALRDALNDLGLNYVVNEGDGAFYGPKIDFHLQDSIGRTWQCGTIQLDFQLPQRFEAEYIGEDGEKHRPIMIHRVVFGSIERFIGILIEHYAGKFPVWLAPVQAKILTLTDRTEDYAKSFASDMGALGLRVATDLRNEKIGYKIREAVMEKVPYVLVVGDKEAAEGKVSVRKRGEEQSVVMTKEEFVELLLQQRAEKTAF
ncbi:MAG: threonine--tRNA ligase, partial [Clostridia bacterium]|nr:threonine--tRNA ligase [Clostridia bacterium]